MDIWYTTIAKFRRKLEQLKTDSTLLEAILLDLDAWKTDMPFSDIIHFPTPIQPIMDDLRQLSYDQFLEGHNSE